MRAVTTTLFSCGVLLVWPVQMRRNPYVQADPALKEMLLDAFESRCLAHSQQPVYRMGPVPGSNWTHPGW
jgi:hypothetical protein